MCIKIVHTEKSVEFDPSEPLEFQVAGAREILVSYNPSEKKEIDIFVEQMELIACNGYNFEANIKVSHNDNVNGRKLEKTIEKIQRKLRVNEVIKGLCKLHSKTDSKLCEISATLGKINER